ncbi:MAG: type I restriction enzyme HsdR N-terminal domain-containing protein [Fibrobacter sp.]|nr:type I restriction enzyme HsdR N-terminal domain-containing protein [Fibrobacter sp.]
MSIYDPVRQKFVEATPEEHVRQKLILWLHEDKKVPLHLMEVESSLSNYRKNAPGRVDVLVHGTRQGRGVAQPWILAECKTRDNSSWEELQVQISRYLKHLQPEFLILDLDTQRKLYQVSKQGRELLLKAIKDIPEFMESL